MSTHGEVSAAANPYEGPTWVPEPQAVEVGMGDPTTSTPVEVEQVPVEEPVREAVVEEPAVEPVVEEPEAVADPAPPADEPTAEVPVVGELAAPAAAELSRPVADLHSPEVTAALLNGNTYKRTPVYVRSAFSTDPTPLPREDGKGEAVPRTDPRDFIARRRSEDGTQVKTLIPNGRLLTEFEPQGNGTYRLRAQFRGAPLENVEDTWVVAGVDPDNEAAITDDRATFSTNEFGLFFEETEPAYPGATEDSFDEDDADDLPYRDTAPAQDIEGDGTADTGVTTETDLSELAGDDLEAAAAAGDPEAQQELAAATALARRERRRRLLLTGIIGATALSAVAASLLVFHDQVNHWLMQHGFDWLNWRTNPNLAGVAPGHTGIEAAPVDTGVMSGGTELPAAAATANLNGVDPATAFPYGVAEQLAPADPLGSLTAYANSIGHFMQTVGNTVQVYTAPIAEGGRALNAEEQAAFNQGYIQSMVGA